jgi:hypothetical protein
MKKENASFFYNYTIKGRHIKYLVQKEENVFQNAIFNFCNLRPFNVFALIFINQTLQKFLSLQLGQKKLIVSFSGTAVCVFLLPH